jgi:DNA repair protein RadD
MFQLRDYQKQAVEACYRYLREHAGNPAIVCPTGSGKSYLIAQICNDAVSLWSGRVLILAHVKELLEQNADKVRYYLDDGLVGLYSAGLKQRDMHQPVIAASIQSVYKRACEFEPFDLVIVDECFPAGTLVSTPRGEIPIENLYIGQPVHTALGTGEIEAISARNTSKLIELEFEDGKTIRCTPNHLFFTESGWKSAQTLEVGSCLFSRQDMLALRGDYSSQNISKPGRESEALHCGDGVECNPVLLSQMRSSKEEKTTSLPSSQDTLLEKSKNPACLQTLLLLREYVSSLGQDESEWDNPQLHTGKPLEKAAFLLDILCQESGESHVDSRSQRKGQSDSKSNGAWPVPSWGQRLFDGTAATVVGQAGRRLVSGICGDHREAASERDAQKYQAGHCQSEPQNRDRDRWTLSCHDEPTPGRQKTDGVFASKRVVRITTIQCKGPVAVFNLQIKGHPSYYAGGVLAHNCHLIPASGDGMYRTFLKDTLTINPNLRLIGTTATAFRMESGLICGPDNLLNDICYEVGVRELIVQGYLCALKSKAGRQKADTSSLRLRGGEFIASEVEDLMDQGALVSSACTEIIEQTASRNSVLIFAAGVSHARHIQQTLQQRVRQEVGLVTGDTPAGERAELLARFKRQPVQADIFGGTKPPLKYLVNVNVLTTGFDAPNIDCVVLLRPTNSPGLYYQMVGRSFRLHPSKQDALVLDFGGNILRHGPVDALQIKDRTSGGGDAPAKECPECQSVIHAAYATCPECGYEFPLPEKQHHDASASTAGILSGQIEDTDYSVYDTLYNIHIKRSAGPGDPPTLRVQYAVGLNQWISEWVCFEHTGYARNKAEGWWRARSNEPIPNTVQEAIELAEAGALAETEQITVRSITGQKYDRIINYRLGPKPPLLDGSDERDDGNLPEYGLVDDEIPF